VERNRLHLFSGDLDERRAFLTVAKSDIIPFNIARSMSLQSRAMHTALMGQSPHIPTSPEEMFCCAGLFQSLGLGARGFRLTVLAQILKFVGFGRGCHSGALPRLGATRWPTLDSWRNSIEQGTGCSAVAVGIDCTSRKQPWTIN
jgi:hypothetical protein